MLSDRVIEFQQAFLLGDPDKNRSDTLLGGCYVFDRTTNIISTQNTRDVLGRLRLLDLEILLGKNPSLVQNHDTRRLIVSGIIQSLLSPL